MEAEFYGILFLERNEGWGNKKISLIFLKLDKHVINDLMLVSQYLLKLDIMDLTV